MAFPSNLAATLSGATIRQLGYWRHQGILVPEVEPSRPRALYSFRDVVALRTVVRLRADVSLQKVRAALRTLEDLDLTDHLSTYNLVGYGETVLLVPADAPPVDLVQRKQQQWVIRLEELFEEFKTRDGAKVVNLRHPRPKLEIRELRLGGWPTIRGTRVPYDTIALLAQGASFERVRYFYPQVSRDAMGDAVDFYEEVNGRAV